MKSIQFINLKWHLYTDIISDCSEDGSLLFNSRNISEHIIVGDFLLKKEEIQVSQLVHVILMIVKVF